MAKAPRPGVTTRKEATEAAQAVIWIRIKDQWTSLAYNSVPTRERAIVRRATGLAYDHYADLSSLGTDTVLVLFWLGRRANGEPFLTLTQVEEEYPYETLGVDDWEFAPEAPEQAEENDPEA